MNRARKLRAVMLDWAKAVHEAIGIESPRLFIGVFALAGLILFGITGWIIDRGYRVRLREQKAQAAPLSTAATATSTEPKQYTNAAPTGRDDEPAIPPPQQKPASVVESTAQVHQPKSKAGDRTAKLRDAIPEPPSRSGHINIGANSPVSGSTINTGTINYGPPRPFILTSEDQQKVREKLMAGSAELRLICIGQGCQTANSLAPAFTGTGWKLLRDFIGTNSSITVGADGATMDAGDGIHLMEKEADANAVLALKSALDSIGIKYETAPWKPTTPLPPPSGIILVIGNPR